MMDMYYDDEDTRWLDKSSEKVFKYGDCSARHDIQSWVIVECKVK